MAKPLVSDELWTLIEPLLPSNRPRPKGGRPPIPHRAALSGIRFVLKSGLPWEMLPQEMGCRTGMTCWRRLHAWQAIGIWGRWHLGKITSVKVVEKRVSEEMGNGEVAVGGSLAGSASIGGGVSSVMPSICI